MVCDVESCEDTGVVPASKLAKRGYEKVFYCEKHAS